MSTIRHGVPPLFMFEAPSCWLSRLALAQGQSLKAVVDFLGFQASGDLDLGLIRHGLAELRQKFSLPPSAFAVAASLVGHPGGPLLMRSRLRQDLMGRPLFAYCPCCLKARPTAHLDIHWRFVDWRYCPEHSCLMEVRCGGCGALPLFPVDMARSKAGRAGYATQRRCQRCTWDLASTPPTFLDLDVLSTVLPMEACWLTNGRVLLAALASGQWKYRGSQARLLYLWRCSRLFLPRDWQWEAAQVRIREHSAGQQGCDQTPAPRCKLTARSWNVWMVDRYRPRRARGAADA